MHNYKGCLAHARNVADHTLCILLLLLLLLLLYDKDDGRLCLTLCFSSNVFCLHVSFVFLVVWMFCLHVVVSRHGMYHSVPFLTTLLVTYPF